MQDRATAGTAAGATVAVFMATASTGTGFTGAGSSWSDLGAAGDRGGGRSHRTTILRRSTMRPPITLRRPTMVSRRPTAPRSAMRRRPQPFRSRRRSRHRTSCSLRRAGTSSAAMACRCRTGGSGSRIHRRHRHRPPLRARGRWLRHVDRLSRVAAQIAAVVAPRRSSRLEVFGMGSRTLNHATTAEAYLELLADRGIDVFLGNAGTDFASLVEAFARREADGGRAPRPLVIPHEFVAVSMAHGYCAAGGRPAAVMVHVNVGTGNAATAIITASRANVPVLMSAGRTPVTEEGQLGSRDLHIHWAQESFDQAAMLREYVKWDYELRMPAQVESVVDRALELMQAEPRGPVYLTLPREVLAANPGPLTITSPPRRQLSSERFPDPARVDEAARILARAERPLVLVSAAGIDRRAVK